MLLDLPFTQPIHGLHFSQLVKVAATESQWLNPTQPTSHSNCIDPWDWLRELCSWWPLGVWPERVEAHPKRDKDMAIRTQ